MKPPATIPRPTVAMLVLKENLWSPAATPGLSGFWWKLRCCPSLVWDPSREGLAVQKERKPDFSSAQKTLVSPPDVTEQGGRQGARSRGEVLAVQGSEEASRGRSHLSQALKAEVGLGRRGGKGFAGQKAPARAGGCKEQAQHLSSMGTVESRMFYLEETE